ncbi:Ribosome biogenesis protein Urb1 [Pleurostoma richardsiae]|uniref:Ribosome biogenesis protein Urb1 n=1 Tax=Pleurostoma richardsiae TaxID=41990 RepID=A0AA38RAX1_9PEZI|nr:Ribosome biogenesis protein Urb1 [Pleurostoma richardsiae]
MALRYTAETLIFLRESPLCVKPSGLPPSEEWMGPPPEPNRAQNKNFTDRTKGTDNPLLDQTNRNRPGADRHTSRNGPSPEDIILGPPKTSFASASMRNTKPGENDRDDRTFRDPDGRDRFNFRSRAGEPDNDRFREGRNSNFRRRPDADQDSDGWSTVKPRNKSFGQDGAERFQGRMGGGGRYKDDQGIRDRDDRDNARDRPRRNFDSSARDSNVDEGVAPRKNGLNRGRAEPWFSKDAGQTDTSERPSQRERIDRAKSWRDRDNAERPGDSRGDRGNERTYERRWDRDHHQRVEREPEWLDEPAEEKTQGHTEEDFKKFMESMKAGRGAASKAEEKLAGSKAPAPVGIFDAPEPKVKTAPAVESGPDKFFAAFAGTSVLEMSSTVIENKTESARPKMGKSSSRFTSFFSQGSDSRTQTEPPTPAAVLPSNGNNQSGQQADSEKEAFQALLQKLQRQTLAASATPPGMSAFAAPPTSHELQQKGAISPEPYMQYGMDRPAPRHRPSQPSVQEILAPRPMQPPSQPPSARPEQMLQELVGQRLHAPSQGAGRMDQNNSAINSNTEFLMRLMRAAPEAPPLEQPLHQPQPQPQLLMRMPQPQKQAALPQMQDREPDFHRDRSTSQRQMRSQGPAAIFEEQFHSPEGDSRPPQPTQILQRPPPPGLDHQMQPPWIAGGGHGQMPPQRPMIPPPGLVGNPNRAGPMPAMFPPNFPPGVFPPPDAISGPPPPPRNMQPPPGFFGGPPPPGFIPPPGMGGFQGPEGLPFGAPFDARGMPPPGAAFRRP